MFDRLMTALKGDPIARVSAVEAFSALSTGNGMLIDVRTDGEFRGGHAPGAKCITLQDLNRRVDEIPHDRPVYVICAAGRRSATAAQQLKGMGYDNIIDIAGGFGAWRTAGLPVAMD
ncbi:MAG: rhodanese-like domain-containing protein [Capsulimonadaceae bacterium]